jgi:hypothetical protein
VRKLDAERIQTEEGAMRRKFSRMGALGSTVAFLVLIGAAAHSASRVGEEKYAAQVPGGLAFSEFRGFEGWEVVNISNSDSMSAVILGNPAMIRAYLDGIPDNGTPFPDGAKLAKIHWTPKTSQLAPNPVKVAGSLHDVDFMVKDSKRFADTGGWGYAAFKYDAANARYIPADVGDSPPQENDAKCGAACHVLAQSRDNVFTEYGAR